MIRLPLTLSDVLRKSWPLALAVTVVAASGWPQLSSAFDGITSAHPIVVAEEDSKSKKKTDAPSVKKDAPPVKKDTPPVKKDTPPVKKDAPPVRKEAPPVKKDAPPVKKDAPPPQKEGPPAKKDAPVLRKDGAPPKKDAPKQDLPKREDLKKDGLKKDAPKTDLQKKDSLKKDSPKSESKKDLKKQDLKKDDLPKADPKADSKAPGTPKDGRKGDPKKAGDPKKGGEPKAGGDPKEFGKAKDKGPVVFGRPKADKGPQIDNVKDLRSKRTETKDKSGRIVITEPGGRRIVRDKGRTIILHDDAARMRRWGGARFEVRGADRYTIVRRPGYDIITVTDANGRLLRRYRRMPDGREYVLIDNRRRGGAGPAAAVGTLALLGLAAPVITIPRERYIVDATSASPELFYETLHAPPVSPIKRAYTLDEIRDNVELRDYVRSIDINTINFSSGAWEIGPDQLPRLKVLADAILKLVAENPDTVVLLEGHTDAVGTAEDNLSLSDRRAEAVAEALTTEFQVPPENLVTQGFGEQHLRVQTDGPSRENRRVQARNITSLLHGPQ